MRASFSAPAPSPARPHRPRNPDGRGNRSLGGDHVRVRSWGRTPKRHRTGRGMMARDDTNRVAGTQFIGVTLMHESYESNGIPRSSKPSGRDYNPGDVLRQQRNCSIWESMRETRATTAPCFPTARAAGDPWLVATQPGRTGDSASGRELVPSSSLPEGRRRVLRSTRRGVRLGGEGLL
jgi:hypothetical protein